eukprot:c9877_g1_i1 orf=247-2331(-)
MEFELKAAKAKWEREQKQRKEEARKRLQLEKKAKEEAARQREALEAAQSHRRLQEAQAAAAARLQEESDLFAGDGIRFNVVLRATRVMGDGDKIKLPPSAFEHLSSEGALEKGPMFFEISSNTEPPATTSSDKMPDAIDTTRNMHCGVLEFTASEGYAELPPHVWSNAGLSDITSRDYPSVRIRYVRLPKCTYAKLLTETSDFSDVPNHKAVLETKLRQHATLSEGDLLVVQHGGVDYTLRVSELKPAANVSVLETDMEVDVVQAVSAPGTSSQSRLIPLELGKSESGNVDEGSYKYYKFMVDQKLLEAVNKGDMDLNVHLEIDGGGTASDADLYVAAPPILFPSQHQHQWASHDLGSKVIHLTGAGKTLSSSSYSIGVYGYRSKATYRVWVQSQPSAPITGQRVGLASREMEGDSSVQVGSEVCGNCMQVIPSRTIALHEAYCRRHNTVCKYPGCGVVLRQEELKKHVHCSKCGQSLQQGELEKHLKVYHEPQTCRCGEILERDDMVKHQAMSCPLRMIMCRFCGDMVQAGSEADNIRDKLRGLTQHESQCGSRTAPCESCERAVMLKEMDLHRAAAHDPSSQDGGIYSSAVGNLVKPVVTALPTNPSKAVNCPICSLKFEGAAADTQLHTHLDEEHFSPMNSSDQIEHVRSEESASSALNSSFRSSLSVACPICGLAVHSERDLSLHIDMVH